MKTRKLHTTLRLLKDCDACVDGYKKLRRHLPKGWKLDTHIPLAIILESNGIDDALWALRAVLPEEEIDRNRIARLIAIDFAEHVLPIWRKHNPEDDRPAQAIATARRFVCGEATEEELTVASAAASVAAWNAASAVASAAASAAAWNAASAAAWNAASAAASAAARDTAWNAARDAAWAAARDAARDAAWDAARNVASATTRDAARDAERKWQAGVLLQYLEGNK